MRLPVVVFVSSISIISFIIQSYFEGTLKTECLLGSSSPLDELCSVL